MTRILTVSCRLKEMKAYATNSQCFFTPTREVLQDTLCVYTSELPEEVPLTPEIPERYVRHTSGDRHCLESPGVCRDGFRTAVKVNHFVHSAAPFLLLAPLLAILSAQWP